MRPPRGAATEQRTERLLLRPWRDADRAPFAALNADPEVMRYFPAPLTAAQSDALLEYAAGHLDEHGWGLWALETLESGAFLGFTGLNVPGFAAHFTPAVEVGWRLARSAWGHGYASEAARAAVAVGFERLRLPEIFSFTAAVNLRSRAVMERLGMTHEERDDFDHPLQDADSPLRRQVLYRLPAPV